MADSPQCNSHCRPCSYIYGNLFFSLFLSFQGSVDYRRKQKGEWSPFIPGKEVSLKILHAILCIFRERQVPQFPAFPSQHCWELWDFSLSKHASLSRRRISCQELGQVDCDGWLLKKKDHVGFMAQKWKRFWFVLKGQTLYWYSNPNDEKAVGLINVSAYRLESTREQKKKYVFQLTHEKYKPFIFATETLADLTDSVPAHLPDTRREPYCYSETEAEDPEDDSPRHSADLVRVSLKNLVVSQFVSQDSAGEELESLFKCLKLGGVSFIGKQQVFTREYYRKSFIKRNKNPEINEKVHLIRTLQSTLKAKTAELQLLDIILTDSELTSEKFRHWKDCHQELYQEIQVWWARKLSQENVPWILPHSKPQAPEVPSALAE
uniref:PH domain-containing protein n=1 Tax=Varanus komodoensis TaxID=61221 RepID=A0A8D2J7E9_VARKO